MNFEKNGDTLARERARDKALIKDLQGQLRQVRDSLQFRIGTAIKDAVRSPFRNIPKLPFVMIRIAWQYFTLDRSQYPDPVFIIENENSGCNDFLEKKDFPEANQPQKNTLPGKPKKKKSGDTLRNRKKYIHTGIEEHRFTEFEAFIPLKTSRNSSLCIACVLGSHLYACLKFEARLIPLGPDNWEQLLETEKPDLFILEATWQFHTPEWRGKLIWDGGSESLLKDITKVCREYNIPMVFWNREYRTHAPFFASAASLFDHVFAADTGMADALEAFSGCGKVIHLPPAVQPALQNPVRPEEKTGKKREFSILYDGWADMLEWRDRFGILKEFLKDGLHIVESRYRYVANKLNDLPEFEENIMGYMTYMQLLSAFRAYRVYLVFADSLSSDLFIAQRALEAAACGAVVVYFGPKNPFIPEGVVLYVESNDQLKTVCGQYLEQEHEGGLHALTARRELFLKHTYSHRIRTICNELGISHGWEEYPMISMVTPTKRPGLISQALENYKRQVYPNMEWIIVLNTSRTPRDEIEEKCRGFDDIRVFQLHEEKNIGSCLNLGIDRAKGIYWSKMDDDDDYGPNYILDMMLELRCVDADVFGKPPALIYLEEKDEFYLRTRGVTSQYIQGDGKVPLVCGATISGKTRHRCRVRFAEDLRACVDTDFLRQCKKAGFKIYLSSVYGFTVVRRKEKSLHTWRLDDSDLRQHSVFFGNKEDIKKVMV